MNITSVVNWTSSNPDDYLFGLEPKACPYSVELSIRGYSDYGSKANANSLIDWLHINFNLQED